MITEQDISLMIPTELSGILSAYQCDISSWEHAHFIYSNRDWGQSIVLSRKFEDGSHNGKRLVISGPSQFKIEPYTYSEVF